MTSLRRPLEYAVMTLVALVVGHNLIFLLAYGAGYDEALAHSGHDGAWGGAVAVVLGAAASLLGLAAWQLRRLGVTARRAGSNAWSRPLRVVSLGQSVFGLWLRVTSATIVLFVLQENIEHQRAGVTMPGLAVLGSPAYPNAAFLIAAVSLAVAAVAAVLRWRRAELIARIAAAVQRSRSRPTPEPRRSVIERDLRPDSIVGRGGAVRAPPLLNVRW